MSKQVLIAGLGLIGGSLALAVKKSYPDTVIAGFDLDTNAVRMAMSLRVIDREAVDFAEAAEAADFIILAAPVESTISLIHELQNADLKEGAVITDVGSTKQTVVEAGKLLEKKGAVFIGGHPMAGSHKTGIEAAKERLFENAFYVLTPSEDADTRSIIQLQNLLKGTKAKFVQLDPKTHDTFAGLISHLPHIVASALVHQVEDAGKENPFVQQLAAGGFKDITRIASASPAMWRDILVHNKEVLLPMLSEWQERMSRVQTLVEEEDADGLHAFFDDAKQSRDKLPSRQKGAILPFYDLYVDIPDHPGVISDVTAILAKQQISITNIRIIEAREGILGVLRLSFRSESDLVLAEALLKEHMYETYEAP
ncbi:prephenate dehydrogenase [Alkalicoccus urumqiensis]|uniref:Prephenate dehydrogenase n=1 Tax=Alkalicoccus urumqiensis TaxID=1548213 RepID=A0A2P6MKP2_ALKUR|nr:prephenate dehydrogenase [Alkalicoccus urumqiensis]PRO66821.1 prephenate dehydrogenase [Alkalicoccus urumqiensis]